MSVRHSLTYVSAPKKPKPKKDAKPKFELKDGDRVVFLGNTLIERAQKYGYWETMLTARYPNRKIIFRNLGWDGDTVWAESRGIFDTPEKGYARMVAHVGRIKPTVLFLGYGNNEAFADKKGLLRFVKQYNRLLDDLTKVSAKGVRFVLLAPLRQIWLGRPLPHPDRYNSAVNEYAAAVNQIAERRKLRYVDFNPQVVMTQLQYALIQSREVDLTPQDFRDGWTSNGLHWRDRGYRGFAETMAGQHLHQLGFWAIGANADGSLKYSQGAKAVVKMIPNGLRFDLTGQVYHFNEIMIGVRDLPAGTWELRSGGKTLHRAKVTRNGWNVTLKRGPHVERSEKLRQAIIDKNRFYFHSWRPQNITYLFLFRKHEQGQNAKDVEAFRKLVAAKEQEIDRLKKPVTRTYELIRVKPPAKAKK